MSVPTTVAGRIPPEALGVAKQPQLVLVGEQVDVDAAREAGGGAEGKKRRV